MLDPAGDTISLAARLRDRIIDHGPMPFHDWMEACLYDKRHGYYCRDDFARWGRRGDYRTSPELSPLFGATFARKFSTLYEEMGAPAALTLMEAGAGDGNFAYHVLETLKRRFPSVFSATHYIIDERSEGSRERIRRRLSPFGDRVELLRISELERPIRGGIIFSNELLDSFPVNLVVLREGVIRERHVGLSEEDEFIWVEGELTSRAARYLDKTGIAPKEGETMELNVAASDWIEQVATVLRSGYVVTVDYGKQSSPEGSSPLSLRAYYKHELVENVLARPGEQDITTTIDWSQIMTAGEANGLHTVSHERQDQFLLRAGLLEELELMTSESTTADVPPYLRTSVRDLILPGGMSESFQVLIQEPAARTTET